MNKEEKEIRAKRMREAVTKGWRKKKGLCLYCGLKTNEEACLDGECGEVHDFTKADRRTINNENKEVVNKDVEKSVLTIVSYRKKKNLCLRCGKEPTNSICEKGECELSYIKADMRSEEEITKDPKTVKTNKFKSDVWKSKKDKKEIPEHLNNVYIQRKFVLVVLYNEVEDKRIDFSYIEHLSQKHRDHIVYVIGNDEYSYAEKLKLRSIKNLVFIEDNDDVIDFYLHNCSYYYGYKTTQYADIIKEIENKNYKLFDTDKDVSFRVIRTEETGLQGY